MHKLTIAAEYARLTRKETRCTERQACLVALFAFPELRMDAEELRKVAFINWGVIGRVN